MLKTELYIEKLNELKKELDQKSFNLDSWKLKTINILRTIFGAEYINIEQLDQIHYDYSSWSLRDSSGGKNIDKVLDMAHAIIDTAIFDVTIKASNQKETIQNILDTNQYQKLTELLNQEQIDDSSLKSLLQKLEESQKVNLLQTLLKQNKV